MSTVLQFLLTEAGLDDKGIKGRVAHMKKNNRYAIACPTSMGLRITPENRMAVQNSNLFYMQATSAETNVLNVASSLGRECLALTKFVKGSPVADFIKRQLRARNIRFEGVEVEQGGPWGYRHQFNIADSGKLTFVNGAKATLGNTATASTARGDISVKGDKTELNLIGDIKYGRTNTAADFTVKNNAAVTVNGNIELGYFTQTSGVMAFYKGSLSLTDNAKFTTTGTVTVFLDSAIAMDHTSRLTFGGLSAQSGSITIAVSGYTDGIYKVMENTGANAVDYATVISNWSEIENIGYTILDNSLYIGKADAENYLVNEAYSKYKFGDAIEGKTGYFYGFNAFSSLDEAGRAVKEATRTITVEADLTEDVNTPLFDLKGDLILTAEAPVTVTWNVIGNAADAPDTESTSSARTV